MNILGLFLKIQRMSKIKIAIAVILILLGVTVWIQQKRIKSIKQERDRYEQNSDALLSEINRWRVDSTTMATDVKALRLTVDEFQRYRAEDLAKIKQMGVKIKNLEAAAKHNIEVSAPVVAPIRDSIIIRDTVPFYIKTVEMETPYISLKGTIENDSLIGTVKLPVTLHQAVWIEYKRKCLFWKKIKAVHQTITSDNPYVEITYSEYIMISK